jgi:hypothetical protein
MAFQLYYDFNSYLRQTFGCRVQKITLDAGLSCPNRDGSKGTGGCIYCNARGSGTGAFSQGQNIRQQLLEAQIALERRYKAKKFLAYFQSFCNTYAPLPVLKSLYQEALSVKDMVGLTIGTRPDCVPDSVLDYLYQLSQQTMVWLEYGLQSAHNKTLRRINRGHTVEEFQDAVSRTRQRHLPICVHVILGLPRESREDMLETARYLASLDIQAVKIHLLYVIQGTPLEKWYHKGEYTCLERHEYAQYVAEFISHLPPWIIIQRLTGDPHRDELVAPAWALEKQTNVKTIQETMKNLELYQGKWFPQR